MSIIPLGARAGHWIKISDVVSPPRAWAGFCSDIFIRTRFSPGRRGRTFVLKSLSAVDVVYVIYAIASVSLAMMQCTNPYSPAA